MNHYCEAEYFEPTSISQSTLIIPFASSGWTPPGGTNEFWPPSQGQWNLTMAPIRCEL